MPSFLCTGAHKESSGRSCMRPARRVGGINLPYSIFIRTYKNMLTLDICRDTIQKTNMSIIDIT